MRVLVVGGTGFVGRHLVRRLLQGGHTPLVLARSPRDFPPGAVFLPGDITREAPDLRGVEAAIYLAGIIRERGQTFQQVHVEGVRNLLMGMRRAGVDRLLHMSALGARRGTGSRYYETKAQGEELVRESGLSWTIFRPSLIFGPGDEFFGGVLRGLVCQPLPFVPLIGDGSFPFRPVYVGDVAEAFAGALERGVMGTWDLVGPREYTFRELLERTMEVLGRRKPFLPIPLGLMDRLVPLLGLLPFAPITQDQYRMLKEGNTAPFPEGLRDLLPSPKALEEVLPSYLRC
ncbi:MAG: complex I NDUFA9 subunit family protein [Thermus sp.]|uniref:complex I NDUFA9 subunit family protein n=1 Tax=Thermus sp. TaxID=275 RepID=UPI0025E7B82B|nr:complex I NDUFA9 subunit family protein [Thermus sp.]MCS6867253.1 complex I NDUFA9 subunit family protein [Thermus sp.]MCS7219413.1 complex I NDUFA9 subunit family protein [Thermus sp.]MDW8017430.1 complex I NDUFA9 subunit family protein [Thermus sp.]MDW8358224.1 complex I NDUFA9 subunit family protein [Thermus sp.]